MKILVNCTWFCPPYLSALLRIVGFFLWICHNILQKENLNPDWHNHVDPIISYSTRGENILSPAPCLELAKEGSKILQQKLPEEGELLLPCFKAQLNSQPGYINYRLFPRKVNKGKRQQPSIFEMQNTNGEYIRLFYIDYTPLTYSPPYYFIMLNSAAAFTQMFLFADARLKEG